MKGALPWFVRWIRRAYKRLLCLECSGQQCKKRIFLAVYYFNLRVPTAQQPGQAVGQGRLSLNVCLRTPSPSNSAERTLLAKVCIRRPDLHPKVGEIFGFASSRCTRFQNGKKKRLCADHTCHGECALLLTQRREGERGNSERVSALSAVEYTPQLFW
jgi:hypothetical protein